MLGQSFLNASTVSSSEPIGHNSCCSNSIETIKFLKKKHFDTVF